MKIYLAGSIAAGREFENSVKEISGILEEMGHTIVTKNNVVKNDDKTKSKKLLSVRKYIVKRDLNWLKNSDLFIAEVSTYSHGVGYEHRCAEEFNKPILMLRHSSLSKETYSAFLDGQSYDKLSFSFYDSGNIKKVLERFIKKYER
ncbi:MAG: nucleoside 2-deoxyribosyltransferase [Patescibacteria group bacterium]